MMISRACYQCRLWHPVETVQDGRCPICGHHTYPDGREPSDPAEITERRGRLLYERFDRFYTNRVRADFDLALRELSKPDCDPYDLVDFRPVKDST